MCFIDPLVWQITGERQKDLFTFSIAERMHGLVHTVSSHTKAAENSAIHTRPDTLDRPQVGCMLHFGGDYHPGLRALLGVLGGCAVDGTCETGVRGGCACATKSDAGASGADVRHTSTKPRQLLVTGAMTSVCRYGIFHAAMPYQGAENSAIQSQVGRVPHLHTVMSQNIPHALMTLLQIALPDLEWSCGAPSSTPSLRGSDTSEVLDLAVSTVAEHIRKLFLFIGGEPSQLVSLGGVQLPKVLPFLYICDNGCSWGTTVPSRDHVGGLLTRVAAGTIDSFHQKNHQNDCWLYCGCTFHVLSTTDHGSIVEALNK